MNNQILATLVFSLLVTPCFADNTRNFDEFQRKQMEFWQEALQDQIEGQKQENKKEQDWKSYKKAQQDERWEFRKQQIEEWKAYKNAHKPNRGKKPH